MKRLTTSAVKEELRILREVVAAIAGFDPDSECEDDLGLGITGKKAEAFDRLQQLARAAEVARDHAGRIAWLRFEIDRLDRLPRPAASTMAEEVRDITVRKYRAELAHLTADLALAVAGNLEVR